MKLRKTITSMAFITLLIFFMGFIPAESGIGAKEKYEEKFEKTVPVAKDGKVDVRNISGSIEVTTWDRAEVKIEALKISKASSLSKAEENAGKVTIDVYKEDSIVRIETKYPERRIRSLSVSVNYSLTIPSKAAIEAKSVSGGVRLENIGGMVEAGTVSGSVRLMTAEKGADLHTTSGGIEAEDITGDVDLHVTSGSITARRIKGSVTAETVSGSVKLLDVSEARVVKGKALSGSVIYEGNLRADGRYSLKTHSGRIEIRIPSNSAFDLEAKTFSGSINSDFDITISGKISKRKIRGSVNGGGANVELSAFSGGIYIKKR
ncbi:MAG: DUF4097 family beta strand repeat protein [Candidatus Aminicenantes bacterium]|nr:MAG: DUF4097 family beta strand repeat protein [Candidatus Aminicenantes bacterium]